MSNKNCGIIDGMNAGYQGLCRDETAAVHPRSTSLLGARLPSTGRRVVTRVVSNIEQHAARLGRR